ncbi:RagB/SusD family nutrient uptake outer membrane protein [Winogradskyella echinorum]|uniref:RagB/SusD family nutrient uptake outer membrane protein n=1 Tax=Winogradskyella echinorum TaxID=538189 RepID=A0ABR6Y473_9FLAO|nr:RagB/SusD family nutrient uptake outer membrane protein [Winogradskyella echinorum]MBC3847551.1 RagB/SusD family nutrient uptake outer membrane protein [Winogradskyella echinorum]MBC5751899.1 RagB/SusD family nutrient uptake outer membrane protein [Winogradskyella echinorum]
MKKNVFKFLMLSAVMSLTFSCEKDFINTEPQGGLITLDQLADAASVNPEIVAGTMDGVYTTTFTTGTGGTTGHDDFGHKGYDIFADMLSGDLALSLSTYGWYRASITELQCTQDFTYTDNYQVWRHYYRVVKNANIVIGTLGGTNAQPVVEESRYILGQALAMRAHSMFYLTQYMSRDYYPDAEILPIYDETTATGQPKSTTAEVYAFIENDLNIAIDLLDGYNRPTKTQVNKPVAQAILAYVLASKRNAWPEVAALTAEVMATNGATLMSAEEITGGFNNVATPGWFWGVDITLDIGLGLVSWWGQMDYFSYSYPAFGDSKSIDEGLYNAIPADDARKAQFYTTAGSLYLMPLDKFYDPARQPAGSGPMVNDYVYMRQAEMILLNAEALAKSGQDGPAREMLRTLMSQRVPDTSYLDGLSGTALQDEIYLQTRIELWAEGKSYLALKRNQGTVNRGSNHLSFQGVPMSYDDERLTFEIPEQEIQDNIFINEQNQ